jgi:hypothetical protein
VITLGLMGVAYAGLVGADHHGRLGADGLLQWESTLVVKGHAPLALATPVREDQLVDLRGADPVWDEKRLVTLVPRSTVIVLESRQAAGDGLRPPLIVDSEAVQEVGVDGQAFDPAPSAGLERRIGGWVTSDVGRIEREVARDALRDGQRSAGLDRTPRRGLVLRVDGPRPDGIAGELRVAGAIQPLVVVAASLVALGVLAAGWVGYSRLEALARRERIQAYFESELS